MPHSVSQSSTQGFYVFADDAEAYGEGLPGLTISVSLSKSGGAFNAISPTITDLGGGTYWIAPIAAHRDTLGEIAWRFAADGAVIAPRFERVVAVNDQAAHWGVPAAVLAAAADNPIHANVTHFLGEPAEPVDDVAKQETLLEVQGAVGDIDTGGGIGSGPRAIKITAVSGGDGVPGVRFGIVGTKVTGYSDADGLLSLYVDGDDDDQRTYTLRTVAPAGYASVEDREVTVGSDDVLVTVELTLTALESAEAPKCNVLLPVEDQQRDRLPGVVVRFEFVQLLPGAMNTGVITKHPLKAISDENGEVRITLGRLCRYTATYTTSDGEPKVVTFDTPDEGSFIVLEPEP